ncbi:hypothetical protein V8G54_009353 [Vigna mungo]|uniref:Uncharacterized protein n=1 Tax=Vigna mungo TaxID=3915 RepID=A0AAQ3NWK1_VIGMU
MLLPSNNKVDFGSSSTLTQSLAANPTLKESQISTNSVSRTHPIVHSFPSPVAKCNEKVIAPSYNVLTTKRDMVEFSPVVADNDETHKTDRNKKSIKDTDTTSTTALDANSSHNLKT